eukprot:gene3948-14025_t
MATFNASKASAYNAAGRSEQYRSSIMGLSAHDRHNKLVSDYLQYYRGTQLTAQQHAAQQVRQTDHSALEEGYRFIRTEQDDAPETWEVRMAKKYYARLFKEYCIADLSRYKESKIGMRWRTQKEVVAGKGQFICGARGCNESGSGLASYEVDFAYTEAGENKQALVKLRVCPGCAFKLNYKKERKLAKMNALAGLKRSSPDSRPSTLGAAKVQRTRAADVIAELEAASAAAPEGKGVLPPPARTAAPPLAASGGDQSGQAGEAVSVLPGDDSVWENKPAQEVATQDDEFDDQDSSNRTSLWDMNQNSETLQI